ncbi:hypothetical protein QR680_000720 [Steinernema hermaphroditum]|uniref:AB hydrolase-1 domain-containing protein n=1 Tax=Steinernema hermaphroditum TaxID=289476 RepID=A0AA39LEL0_9BILA|nr:hypothetical protein QR680_000720 [Steinernema hermaphroditum]
MFDEEPVEEFITEVHGLKIAYEKYGRGPNYLLMICGAVGCYKKDFPDHVLRNFDPELVTLIVIDPPGYGKSRPPDRAQEIHRCSKDAKFCLGLMEQLQMTPFGVVGWSEGGRTAIHVADQGKQKVNCMILLATSTKVDYRGSLAFKGMRNVDQWLAASREPYLEYYSLEELRIQWAALCDVVQKVYDDLGGRFPSDFALQQIKCPVLICHGAMDRFCMDPKLMIQSLSNVKPPPRLEIQALGGHDFHLKYARWFSNKVQFLLKTVVIPATNGK